MDTTHTHGQGDSHRRSHRVFNRGKSADMLCAPRLLLLLLSVRNRFVRQGKYTWYACAQLVPNSCFQEKILVPRNKLIFSSVAGNHKLKHPAWQSPTAEIPGTSLGLGSASVVAPTHLWHNQSWLLVWWIAALLPWSWKDRTTKRMPFRPTRTAFVSGSRISRTWLCVKPIPLDIDDLDDSCCSSNRYNGVFAIPT